MKDRIKQAASGKWLDLITSIAGIDPAFLNGSHTPCPKCGGTDRFRALDDFNETGGCLCNQCFNEKNGDGIAVISWLKGWTFQETLAKLADALGIKQPKKAKDPAKHLEFLPWNEAVADLFCIAKPPIKPEAILAVGGRLAKYRKQFTVIAIPVYNSSFNVCGWRIYHLQGKSMLPVYRRGGEIDRYESSLMTAGSKQGLIAPIDRLKTATRVWKCEGEGDCLAFLSMVEDSNEVAICNSNGASEKPAPWIVAQFAGKDAVIVGDCDQPGQKGAKLWSQTLGAMASPAVPPRSVVNLELPFPMQETKGKDLRDFLGDRPAEQLLALAANTAEFQPATNDDGSVVEIDPEFPIQKQHLELLQIEVMFESDDGQIKIYSKSLRKTSTIKDIGRLGKEKLVQMCGDPAQIHIVHEVNDESTEMTIRDAREAIALEASKLRHSHLNECGQGVWMGRDLEGEPTGSIILVGSGSAARYNGDKQLREILVPRVDGLVLDMSSRNEWYDFRELSSLIERAQDPGWRRDVLEKGFEFFGGWRWEHPNGHEIATAMCVASWIQTSWRWRPQMAIIGESNSGKSFFFQALEKMFQGLVLSVSKPTEAGIRQELGISGQVLLVDEFEHDRNRAKVLELIRTSSRGTTVARGTPGGKSIRFGLKHIAWVAAIEAGIEKQADVNRFIQLELLRAKREDAGKLQLPSAAWLHQFGQEMLAVAITIAARAVEVAGQGKETKIPGVDQRVIESFSVPSSVIACAVGNEELAAGFLTAFSAHLAEDQQEPVSDQEELLSDILSSTFRVRSDEYTIAAALSSADLRNDPHIENRMKACGVKLSQDGDLFIAYKLIAKNLNRDLQGRRIDSILQRIDGAKKKRARMSGTVPWVISIPRAFVEKMGVDTSGNKSTEQF